MGNLQFVLEMGQNRMGWGYVKMVGGGKLLVRSYFVL